MLNAPIREARRKLSSQDDPGAVARIRHRVYRGEIAWDSRDRGAERIGSETTITTAAHDVTQERSPFIWQARLDHSEATYGCPGSIPIGKHDRDGFSSQTKRRGVRSPSRDTRRNDVRKSGEAPRMLIRVVSQLETRITICRMSCGVLLPAPGKRSSLVATRMCREQFIWCGGSSSPARKGDPCSAVRSAHLACRGRSRCTRTRSESCARVRRGMPIPRYLSRARHARCADTCNPHSLVVRERDGEAGSESVGPERIRLPPTAALTAAFSKVVDKRPPWW
jgi:hypothetical protein